MMSDNLFIRPTGTGKSRMIIDTSGLHCINDAVNDQFYQVWKRSIEWAKVSGLSFKKDDKPFEIAFIKDDGSLDMSVYVGDTKLFTFTFPSETWRLIVDSRGRGVENGELPWMGENFLRL